MGSNEVQFHSSTAAAWSGLLPFTYALSVLSQLENTSWLVERGRSSSYIPAGKATGCTVQIRLPQPQWGKAVRFSASRPANQGIHLGRWEFGRD